MTDGVELGRITCPSGELVLIDGGYLRLWSGDRAPEAERPADFPAAVDLEIVGPDAVMAARTFGRQTGTMLFDIPVDRVAEITGSFAEHCAARGRDASLRLLDRQVPHRERVRAALARGDRRLSVNGVPVVVMNGLVTDRPSPVVGIPGDDGGWLRIRVEVRPGRAAYWKDAGFLGVDHARFAVADADALNSWVHSRSLDGLADVVFWGPGAEEVGGEPVDEDSFGRLDLPVEEAAALARDLDGRGIEADFRPHSHHWRVMEDVRDSADEAATIEVGGASVLFAMTSADDGFFPVHAEYAENGDLLAIQITISEE
ncbi:hypothetical protein [Hamadaea tsunoensis]|uniref:hypothetical protein n=1 Tax=Hamadaea tsunoensis TaxID=53368 RepID=UPI000410E3B7|nr:hypothetical protein [Hamadaea tsunoensis]